MNRHGWLSPGQDRPAARYGREISDRWARREEYNLVTDLAERIGSGQALDLGCGYLPDRHIAPELIAEAGLSVLAVDHDERLLEMPHRQGVTRLLLDFEQLHRIHAQFDLVVCLSAIEHVDPDLRDLTIEYVKELTRPGGWLYISGDRTDVSRWPEWLEPEFDTGELEEEPRDRVEAPLCVMPDPSSKWSSYCIARRRS